MNKLEQIRNENAKKESEIIFPIISSDFKAITYYQYESFKKGFDAAIALQLSVKFAEYLNEEYILESGGYWRHKISRASATTLFIYNYWITNIFET